MKKIFTLVIGSLFAFTVMAAGNKPSVTIKSQKNYTVVIDGKSYKANGFMDVSGIFPGYHSIKVYETNTHLLFRKKAKLISSSSFTVNRRDVVINVDRFGQIAIAQPGVGNNREYNKGWDNSSSGKDNQREDHRNNQRDDQRNNQRDDQRNNQKGRY